MSVFVAMALLDSGNNVVAQILAVGVYPQLNWAPGPITLASTMSFNSVRRHLQAGRRSVHQHKPSAAKIYDRNQGEPPTAVFITNISC